MIGQRFAAWIAAVLTALNITVSSTLAPAEKYLDYLADPFDLVYSYPEEKLDSFLDQSRLHITPNYTQIDGVWYDNVWLSHDAAEKFRVNAGDLQTAYDIVSNSNGTFASGFGYSHGIPLFNNGSRWASQLYYLGGAGSFQVGNVSLDVTFVETTSNYDSYSVVCTLPDGSSTTVEARDWLSNPHKLSCCVDLGNAEHTGYPCLTFGDWNSDSYPSGYFLNPRATHQSFLGAYTAEPFDFDWVSGVIPADPQGPEDGLRMLVPHKPDGTSHLQPLIDNDSPFLQPEGKTIDVDVDPDIGLEIDDLMDIIIPLIPIIKAEFGEDVPSPGPVDPTLISNTPWVTLQNKLDEIINVLSDPQLSPILAPVLNIAEAVSSLPDSLQNIIQSLGDIPSTILEDIEQGPIKVFDKALDKLKSVFSPILISLKNAFGIWHYVPEWFSSISAPWSFFWGVYQNLGSAYLLPIYASIAGYIVISVYKRFGR